MKKILAGLLLGAGIPLTLGLANELLFASRQINSGVKAWDAVQICAFERRWFPLYPKVIHAKGCRNKTADALVPLILLSSVGGAVIGGASGRFGNQRNTNNDLSKGMSIPSIWKVDNEGRNIDTDTNMRYNPGVIDTKTASGQVQHEERLVSLKKSSIGQWVRSKSVIFSIVAVASAIAAVTTLQKGGIVLITGNKSNVVKVLDRVTCHDDYLKTSFWEKCSQEMVDNIWSLCLRNGYSEETPTERVKTSREIDELVQETTYKSGIRFVDKEVTDENGIVSTVQVEETYQDPITVKGFCIGSEYILD